MPLLPCNRLLLASGHEDSSPSYAPRFAAFSWEKLCPCGLAAADDALLIVLEATGIVGHRSCSKGLTPRQAAWRKELGGWFTQGVNLVVWGSDLYILSHKTAISERM